MGLGLKKTFLEAIQTGTGERFRSRSERALRRVDDGEVEKHEALEVVGDARAELQKERPNRLRLRSLLGGLAQGVQVLDGLKGAGEFLSRLVPLI